MPLMQLDGMQTKLLQEKEVSKPVQSDMKAFQDRIPKAHCKVYVPKVTACDLPISSNFRTCQRQLVEPPLAGSDTQTIQSSIQQNLNTSTEFCHFIKADILISYDLLNLCVNCLLELLMACLQKLLLLCSFCTFTC